MIELLGLVSDIEPMVKGEVSYSQALVKVARKSGYEDNLIIFYNNKSVKISEGKYYRIQGDVRSYKGDGVYKKRIKVYVTYADEVDLNSLSEDEKTLNKLEEEVKVVKSAPMRRTGKNSNLKITDLVLGKEVRPGRFYGYNAIAFGSKAVNH